MPILTKERLEAIKTSFATRRVSLALAKELDSTATGYNHGDLVVARIAAIGQHSRIERPDGRRAILFPGDEVLLACGARYAPDQFEAGLPEGPGPAHMVAAGGIAGQVLHAHEKMKPATEIEILGVLRDRTGCVMNLADYAVVAAPASRKVPVIAVCGASMNSGKTHTVASIVRGQALAGKTVAAIKITGTGAGGDLWFFRDSGAAYVADFTDAGHATTYKVDPGMILAGARRLMADAVQAGADVIVLEIADGLRQEETAAILRSEAMRNLVDAVVYACGDAMSAEAGIAWLRKADLPVRAVSGCIARSPLAMREAEAVIDIPCLTPVQLWDGGATNSRLFPQSADRYPRIAVAA